jgi:hypothetical protein
MKSNIAQAGNGHVRRHYQLATWFLLAACAALLRVNKPAAWQPLPTVLSWLPHKASVCKESPFERIVVPNSSKRHPSAQDGAAALKAWIERREKRCQNAIRLARPRWTLSASIVQTRQPSTAAWGCQIGRSRTGAVGPERAVGGLTVLKCSPRRRLCFRITLGRPHATPCKPLALFTRECESSEGGNAGCGHNPDGCTRCPSSLTSNLRIQRAGANSLNAGKTCRFSRDGMRLGLTGRR